MCLCQSVRSVEFCTDGSNGELRVEGTNHGHVTVDCKTPDAVNVDQFAGC